MSKPVPDGPDPVDISVGQRVAARRLELGYNQSDLGRALGLTFQQVQKYEKGTNRISASKLWAISQFLKVDVAHFFVGLSGEGFHPEAQIPSRLSQEISKAVNGLASADQKLVLDLARRLSAAEPSS
ncbi:MAG: helix-turn-helix transcriptional regulator [Brevundimonas sp.]|uniref:helix-turn-helix domain-containing protein n=1 Tax=Brevundimonas sp. TaxID=1871086 RepID=UPI001A2B94FC|nr:helix-turn-helix transcriptional regulator [Brevundimonas sp.]MBJ7446217.1 helix-turn-helix transcriptional regulator [Brevundimonas sp.]